MGLLKVASVKSHGNELEPLHELTCKLSRTLLGFRRTTTLKVTVSSTKKFLYYNSLGTVHVFFTCASQILSGRRLATFFLQFLRSVSLLTTSNEYYVRRPVSLS